MNFPASKPISLFGNKKEIALGAILGRGNL
jgi:hypothetical protein